MSDSRKNMLKHIRELERCLDQTLTMYDRGRLHYSKCEKAARELARARNHYYSMFGDTEAANHE